jgi:hypothetical protein
MLAPPPGAWSADFDGGIAVNTAKWIAGASLTLLLAAAPLANATVAKDVAGDWMGTLHAQGAAVHIVVHLHRSHQGGYVGTLDNPERGAASVPLKSVATSDGVLTFAVADGAGFRGGWDDAHGQWRGTWTEAGASWPLSLKLNDNDSVEIAP